MIRVLHTSDWHLGCGLRDQKRDDEFQRFLNWVLDVIRTKEINVVVISGDIFDTYSPSNEARKMYYNFLASAMAIPTCWNIVVTAGNHDSSTFIDAPADVLDALKITVVGAARDPKDEVFSVSSPDGQVRLIVAAVPFLRDADVRRSISGDDASQAERAYQAGVIHHYQSAAQAAEQLRAQLNPNIPIVAMGHLYTTGCEYFDGEDRQIVGNLNGVPPETFPASFDYVALGHIHIPQKIANHDHIRYCGSPLQLQFNEAHSRKICCIVEFDGRTPSVSEIEVPVFHKLAVVQGELDDIKSALEELVKTGTPTYVQVQYTGENRVSNLSQTVEAITKGTNLNVLSVINKQIIQKYLNASNTEEQDLNELTPELVFKRLMTLHNVSDENQRCMSVAYGEVINSIRTGSAISLQTSKK